MWTRERGGGKHIYFGCPHQLAIVDSENRYNIPGEEQRVKRGENMQSSLGTLLFKEWHRESRRRQKKTNVMVGGYGEEECPEINQREAEGR